MALKYKVGDKVRIKSLEWYNENKDEDGIIELSTCVFTPGMSQFCGKVMTIEDVFEDIDDNGIYYMEEIDYDWTDEMIKGLVEEETKFGTASNPIEPKSNANCLTRERVDEMSFDTKSEWLKHEISLPEGYIFVDENGNVINATKIVLEKNIIREEQIDNAAQEYIDSDNAVLTYSDGFCEQTDHPFVRAAFKAGVEWADNNVTQDDCSKAPKLTSQDYSNGRFGYRLPAGFEAKLTERELILTPEKPKYPKSLLDCENVLNGVRNDRKKLLHKFNELLICRDAYWKIAGDEMGLGKPWKPDWSKNERRYTIEFKLDYIHRSMSWVDSCILAFPTEEMRDAFYGNFKELIESVKELL